MSFPSRARKACEFLRQVYCEYSNDNGGLMAAAISFYVFLSLVPLVLLAVAAVGFVLGSPERAQDIVFAHIRPYAPELKGVGIGAMVQSVVRGRAAATGVGLAVLIWAGTSMFAALERAINVAWDVEVHRKFVTQRLRALGLMLLVGGLFVASFAATAAFEAIRHLHVRILGIEPLQWRWIWRFLGYALPLVVSIAAFTLQYKILPNVRVPIKIALIGGVFAGILWEIAKLAFGYYVSSFASYNKIYGSLGGMILLIVWINYSAVVTILGAEVASVMAKGSEE